MSVCPLLAWYCKSLQPVVASLFEKPWPGRMPGLTKVARRASRLFEKKHENSLSGFEVFPRN
jgi:hypothetical protein